MKYILLVLLFPLLIPTFAQKALPKYFTYDDVFFEVGQKNRILVLFEYDSDKLFITKGIDSLATFLKLNPRLHITIEHHFDSRWTDFYSSRLDFNRAKSVKWYLVKAGIDHKRITAIGKGDKEILNRCKEGVDCSDAEHQVNRRTMAVITKIDTLPKYDYFTFEDSVFEIGQVQHSKIQGAFWNPSRFNNNDIPHLQDLIDFLNQKPNLHIALEAHTDARGNDYYNTRIAQRLAENLVKYLINKGIAPNRLNAVGKGESEILNHCKEGIDCSDEEHQVNRRVILKITKI